MDSICKTKPFEDWWARDGRFEGLNYEIIRNLYQFFRFEYADKPCSKDQICTKFYISRVVLNRYCSILIQNNLFPENMDGLFPNFEYYRHTRDKKIARKEHDKSIRNWIKKRTGDNRPLFKEVYIQIMKDPSADLTHPFVIKYWEKMIELLRVSL